MQLKIENLGMIERAEVSLDGLTVIAGDNDTGKSTVGRLWFALIKALSRYEQDLEENREIKIRKIAEMIYFLLRKELSNLPYIHIRHLTVDEFYPRTLINSLQADLFGTTEKKFNDIKQKLLSLLASANIEHSSNSDKTKTEILHHLDKLETILFQEENKEEIIKRALQKTFFSEFYSEITPKRNLSLLSRVSVFEGEHEIVEIGIQSNKVNALRFTDDLFFEDATFIESPIYLQFYRLINYADTLLDTDNMGTSRPKVALHIKDLINKIENAQYSPLFDLTEFQGLEQQISEVVNGIGFNFSSDERDFLFYKTEEITYRPINAASGVKAFGTLQLLLKANVLGKRRPLIIDEPETHLHPTWQVEYAKIIIKLVEQGIPVLLTSHSPYLIQALKVLSENSEIRSQTHFYLAEQTENDGSLISEVTDELNQIFAKLSKPLRELV